MTAAHIPRSRASMGNVGGGGFPTLVLERDGHLTVLDYDRYSHAPAGWQRALQAHAGSVSLPSSAPR